MAARKNPLADKAYEMYKDGMKLIEIAAELNVPDGTVRRWKNNYGWGSRKRLGGESERSDKKSERSQRKNAEEKQEADNGIEEVLQNTELNPKQQLFCLLYSRTFNATQSYLNAYGCSWETAHACGTRLLANVSVKTEIERLKKIKGSQIVAGAEDIVELQMRIAFADMGNYLQFDEGGIRLRNSDQTDTQLIKEIKEGKNGVAIKLADSQKAIEWLSKYFTLHPDDKYKAEYDRKRAEMGDNSADILANMQTIADILKNPAENREIEALEEGIDEHAGTA